MYNILDVTDLTISIGGRKVVDNVGFSVPQGGVLALVGESGSGKTMTAMAILKLLPPAAKIEKGKIIFRGENILEKKERDMRGIRGRRIGMVFQEPFTALNPVMRASDQIAETLIAHGICKKQDLNARVNDLLGMVKLPIEVRGKYPHELSGGMRQRVMLAIALSCDPEFLILDEPTTALDVMLQKHILDTIKHIQRERRITTLFITHDLSVVNMLADNVCVMRNGLVVESGSRLDVLKSPQKKYTQHLISCIPVLGDKRRRLPVEI